MIVVGSNFYLILSMILYMLLLICPLEQKSEEREGLFW